MSNDKQAINADSEVQEAEKTDYEKYQEENARLEMDIFDV